MIRAYRRLERLMTASLWRSGPRPLAAGATKVRRFTGAARFIEVERPMAVQRAFDGARL
jgi:hypothetical protein